MNSITLHVHHACISLLIHDSYTSVTTCYTEGNYCSSYKWTHCVTYIHTTGLLRVKRAVNTDTVTYFWTFFTQHPQFATTLSSGSVIHYFRTRYYQQLCLKCFTAYRPSVEHQKEPLVNLSQRGKWTQNNCVCACVTNDDDDYVNDCNVDSHNVNRWQI